MRLVVTRPFEEAHALCQALNMLGHEAIPASLLEIVSRQNVVVPRVAYQAICITSANGMRCLGATPPLATPVYAVGEQSAQAARVKGFTSIHVQGPNVAGLARYVVMQLRPGGGPLLYPSGAEVSGDLKGELEAAGFTVDKVITYDAKPLHLDHLHAGLQNAEGVLLYSPRSAKLWQSEMTRLGLEERLSQIMHFCLSGQVAAALGQDLPRRISATTSEASLLDLVGKAA